MKRIINIMLLFICMAGFASCSDDDDSTYVEPTEIVSYKTVDGTWMLSKWNGADLIEGQYCYIVMNRNEHTFIMYQNFDSQYSRSISGTFTLDKDDDGKDYISGSYDYNNGDWNDDYYLTIYGGDNKRMEWIASEDAEDVQVYVPCAEVPADILAGTRAAK